MNSARTKKFGKLLIVLFALASVMMTVAFAEGDALILECIHRL